MKFTQARTFCLSITLVALNACAVTTQPRSEQAFIETSIADTATTAAALATGAGYETNPLGFGGVTAMKVGLYMYAKDLPPEQQEILYRPSNAVLGGVSINNLLVLFGASTPASMFAGLLTGLHLYFSKPAEPQAELAHTGDQQ